MLPTPIRTRTRAFLDSPFDALEHELSRAVNYINGAERDASSFYPVDVREDDDHIYVEAEMPGFKADEIDITLSHSVLSIVGRRKVEENKPGEKHLSERRYTHVARSFTMPKTVDNDKIDATLKDGVLHLVLHKREDVKPRKIEVRTSE